MVGKTLAIAALAVLAMSAPSKAAVFNLAADFSSNNGTPWAYGYFDSTGGSHFFPTYTPASSGSAIESWTDASLPQTSAYGTPNASHNTSSSEVTQFGSLTFLPGQATFHPGQNGEFASYRFTAPTTGTYQLSALFSGRDFGGPTDTQVSIATGVNGILTTDYTGVVNGYAGDSQRAAFGVTPTANYSSNIFLQQGNNLFFNVGFDPAGMRSSGPFYYDTTGIDVSLTTGAVPEPSTWAMMLLGFGALGFLAYRKTRYAEADAVMIAA